MNVETESRIAFLKAELAETDYAPIRRQRAAYRAEINALQGGEPDV